ncbi:MAG: DUF763 domain-containing protein, partial [Candidatus Aenigmarchaeota archaeon]|nr:DUF763 domain-containing protein [Candidatus Aenigmarchaeota archaeon]
YHWFYENVKSFVNEPHSGIIGDKKELLVLDMTNKENEEVRKVSVDIAKEGSTILKCLSTQTTLNDFFKNIPFISMPKKHEITSQILTKDTIEFLKKTEELQPQNYEELILLNGCGPKKIRALALLSQLLFGTEIKWKDPLKYTFTHGGKDGYPHPIDKETYENSIEFLKEVIRQAKLNEYDKINALKRLSQL